MTKQVAAFEYDCRIERVYTAAASFKSAREQERAGQLAALNRAVDLLSNAKLARANGRLSERAGAATLMAYRLIQGEICA
jgi:hypothetical protein